MAGLDRRLISVKGGGDLQLRQIDPTPSDPFVSIGYLKSINFSDQYNMVESLDGAGNKIDIKEAGQKVILKGMLLQTSKQEIDFQKNAKGQYHDIYYQVQLNNAKYQEFSLCVCRIKPGMILDFKPGERTIEIEIHALVPKGAFTRTPTAYNVVANIPYVLTEGVSANGAPTDTAASLATAVI